MDIKSEQDLSQIPTPLDQIIRAFAEAVREVEAKNKRIQELEELLREGISKVDEYLVDGFFTSDIEYWARDAEEALEGIVPK